MSGFDTAVSLPTTWEWRHATTLASFRKTIPPLTLPERRALQDGLTRAGFDAGGVDGRIGPKTIAAIKAFQRAQNLVPDGYPSPEILARLP